MKKRTFCPPAVLCIILCLFAGLSAQQTRTSPRAILALYSSSTIATPDETEIHRFAELPLNYLGFYVRYWNIDRGTPPAEVTRNVRGILVWNRDLNIQDAEQFGQWLIDRVREGKKLAILGRPQILSPFENEPNHLLSLKKELFREIGLEYRANPELNQARISVRSRAKDMVEFERRIPDPPPYYEQYHALDDTRSYLTLNSKKHGPSDVVATSDTGGFALENYILHEFLSSDRTAWRLNPFLFFRRAFDAGELPAPNVNLMNGHRLFLSSIDGDGFLSDSLVKAGASAPEVIYRHILKEYVRYPVAASYIVAEISPEQRGSQENIKLARKMAALPHVEGASHTWAHPYNWIKGEYQYDYPEGTYYSMETEINGSVSYINNRILEPVGKSMQIYLWSGHTNPPPEALRRLDRLGIPNLNGGEFRLDELYTSRTNVSPYARPVGDYLQPYAAVANEYTYTDGWKHNYHAIENIKKTWKYTDRERLLRPVHLYYHFYIGAKKASYNALRNLYEHLRNQTLTRVFPSRYSRMVLDFHRARIARTDDGFRLKNWNHIRTATFHNRKTHPDLSKSRGIIGYAHRKGNTHIFLADRTSHRLVLNETSPDTPYLAGATGWVHSFEADDGTLRMTVEGIHQIKITIAGLPSDATYSFRNRSVSSDGDGRLRLTVRLQKPERTPIKLQRTS